MPLRDCTPPLPRLAASVTRFRRRVTERQGFSCWDERQLCGCQSAFVLVCGLLALPPIYLQFTSASLGDTMKQIYN